LLSYVRSLSTTHLSFRSSCFGNFMKVFELKQEGEIILLPESYHRK